MTAAVALLRGINVGGHRRVPIADLRAVAESIGFEKPRTYVASGNLVFETGREVAEAVAELERAIEKRFGFPVDVIGRSRTDWWKYVHSNPFLDAARKEPKWVWMFLSKQPPRSDAASELAKAATELEVAQVGDAIWVNMPKGVSMTMLRIKWDKLIGSPSSSRNWRTVETIGRMLDEGQTG